MGEHVCVTCGAGMPCAQLMAEADRLRAALAEARREREAAERRGDNLNEDLGKANTRFFTAESAVAEARAEVENQRRLRMIAEEAIPKGVATAREYFAAEVRAAESQRDRAVALSEERRLGALRLMSEVDEARRQRDRAVEVLRGVEWSHIDADDLGYCRVCEGGFPVHAIDCALASVIRGEGTPRPAEEACPEDEVCPTCEGAPYRGKLVCSGCGGSGRKGAT